MILLTVTVWNDRESYPLGIPLVIKHGNEQIMFFQDKHSLHIEFHIASLDYQVMCLGNT
jgi:hypothetical protein